LAYFSAGAWQQQEQLKDVGVRHRRATAIKLLFVGTVDVRNYLSQEFVSVFCACFNFYTPWLSRSGQSSDCATCVSQCYRFALSILLAKKGIGKIYKYHGFGPYSQHPTYPLQALLKLLKHSPHYRYQY
jgi:hypothetical protein